MPTGEFKKEKNDGKFTYRMDEQHVQSVVGL